MRLLARSADWKNGTVRSFLPEWRRGAVVPSEKQSRDVAYASPDTSGMMVVQERNARREFGTASRRLLAYWLRQVVAVGGFRFASNGGWPTGRLLGSWLRDEKRKECTDTAPVSASNYRRPYGELSCRSAPLDLRVLQPRLGSLGRRGESATLIGPEARTRRLPSASCGQR